MLRQAVHTHIITSRHGVPLMIEQGHGLVIEITDGDFHGYRGHLFYDLVKVGVIRLAYGMSWDLKDRGVTALAVTPGFLRSEAVLDHFGVTEENWRDAVKKDPHFAQSETPTFVGRAVAALAADPHVQDKAGRVWASWTLAREYGFRDADGQQPDWGSYMDRTVADILDRGAPLDGSDRFLLEYRRFQIDRDPSRADEAERIDDLMDNTDTDKSTAPASEQR